MISNLLVMVIVGGYETFVSRLDLEGHPDQPNVGAALRELRAVCEFFKVLGSYPVDAH